MYEKILANHEYFKDYINEDIFDSLTQVISRKYILEYTQYLIDKKVPFSFYIVDIDNFKSINDKYGHSFGDITLVDMASKLVEIVGNKGYVGRFGGDEFVIINLKDTTYDEMKQFFGEFYNCQAAFRRTFEYEDVEIYLTGTSGAASFPKDADNFDELFEKADKALYRGKTKGRNCYIIYVHEKHKDIDISSMNKETVDSIMDNLSKAFVKGNSFRIKILDSLRYVTKSLKISGAIYIDNNMNYLFDTSTKTSKLSNVTKEDIDYFFDESNLVNLQSLKIIGDNCHELYKLLKSKHILSMLFKKISLGNESYGYIAIFDTQISRLWQNDDVTIITFLEKMIGITKYYSD